MFAPTTIGVPYRDCRGCDKKTDKRLLSIVLFLFFQTVADTCGLTPDLPKEVTFVGRFQLPSVGVVFRITKHMESSKGTWN